MPAGHVTGRLIGAGAMPVPYVVVTAYRLVAGSWAPVEWATTDADGRYDLGNLFPGTVRLQFRTYDGRQTTEFWDDATTIDTATDVPVTAGGVASNRDAILSSAARVTGKVTDSTGAGLPGVVVRAYAETDEVVRATIVNGEGWYDLGGLPAGTFTLGFTDPDETYAPEFWNNKRTLGAADRFEVGAMLRAGFSRGSELTR